MIKNLSARRVWDDVFGLLFLLAFFIGLWLCGGCSDARAIEPLLSPELEQDERTDTRPIVGGRLKELAPGPVLGDLDVADIRTFTDPRPPATRPTTRPLPRPVIVRPPVKVGAEGIEVWLDHALQQAASRFEVPEPRYLLVADAPKRGEARCLGCVTYLPEHRGFVLWKKYADGSAVPEEQLRRAVMHAFLHHCEAVRGLAQTGGVHEAPFDHGAIMMGLWRPRR